MSEADLLLDTSTSSHVWPALASRADDPPRSAKSDRHELDARTITALRSALHRAEEQRGLERYLAIGRALVQHIYDGDVHGWRDRSPKAPTLRRLTSLTRIGYTPAALCRALAVFEVWSTIAQDRDWKLSASHYRAVHDLPPEQQAELLELAHMHDLSSDRLRELATRRSERRARRGGRLPKHAVARLVERLERELANVPDVSLVAPGEGLSIEQAANLATRCDGLVARCKELARRLRRA